MTEVAPEAPLPLHGPCHPSVGVVRNKSYAEHVKAGSEPREYDKPMFETRVCANRACKNAAKALTSELTGETGVFVSLPGD